MELEESGIDSNLAVNRVFIILTGELLEILRMFNKVSLKAVKPLKYGVERVQTFESFIEDHERYASEQLGKYKKSWAVDLRDFLKKKIPFV